jgi:LAS superfamily LD-carboxypeptidase LdcB
MLLTERFKNTKKLLNGVIPIGGNKASGAKMTNGFGNSTGVSGNKITNANDLTKGMGKSIGVAGSNNIVGFDRKPDIKKTKASGNDKHFSPAELVKSYEQKQAEVANNLEQKQTNLAEKTNVTVQNNPAQPATQGIKRQGYAGIQSVVSRPEIIKVTQPEPINNQFSNQTNVQVTENNVQQPLGVGQNQFFNQTESLTKSVTAAQVGTGGKQSYGVGAGNVNNDPSFSVGQNVNSLVSGHTSTKFVENGNQNTQAFNQPKPLVNPATQTAFTNTNTNNPYSEAKPISSTSPIAYNQQVDSVTDAVKVGQQSQYSTSKVNSSDPLSNGFLNQSQNSVNSPINTPPSTSTNSIYTKAKPISSQNSYSNSSGVISEVVKVGEQSQNSANKISSDDPLSKGFLGQSQSSAVSPIVNVQKEKIYGVGENKTTQEAKNISESTHISVIEDLSSEPVSAEVISTIASPLTKNQIIDRILRETIITISKNCQNVTENYLVDIGFEFPADLVDKIKSLNLRAKIGRDKDFSSSLIRKDPTGKWYALVDIGELGNSNGGFREILLDLGKSQPKDELFSNQPKPGVYLTKADYNDSKYKENLDNHNYTVSAQRGEKYGSTALNEKYALYEKIAKETKLSSDSKSEFKSKEAIELYFVMPKLGKTERIPKTLRVVLDDGINVQYLIQIDTSNPNPDYFKYYVNLGSRTYNEKHDKLKLSLVAPSDVTGQREEFWKFEKVKTIRILSEESKIKTSSIDSSESLGQEDSETLKAFKQTASPVSIIAKGKQNIVEVGQSNSTNKVIGLNGALGLAAMGGSTVAGNLLNTAAASGNQAKGNNFETSSSTNSTPYSESKNRAEQSSSSNQNSYSNTRQTTENQRSSSAQNQNNQSQNSARPPLGSASRPPTVIPIDPNLPNKSANRKDNSIPVGQQSYPSQKHNLGQAIGAVGAIGMSGGNSPIGVVSKLDLNNLQARTKNNSFGQGNSPAPSFGSSRISPVSNLGQTSGGSSVIGSPNFGAALVNYSTSQFNSNNLQSNNISLGQSISPINNLGQSVRSFSPLQSLNNLKNPLENQNSPSIFGTRNLPNSGVISAPYQFSTNTKSLSSNNTNNQGQPIQYGGVNGDRPLIDAKGNPIPIRRNNSGSIRTGLSATLSTTDVLGVATAGVLIPNSTGRANLAANNSTSNSSGGQPNNQQGGQDYQVGNKYNSSQPNTESGDGGNQPPNQPPNNRPRRPEGGDDDDYQDNDENPEYYNDGQEDNEPGDPDSSAIVPYQDDVVDGVFVDEDNQPLDNPDRPPQRLLSGSQMQALVGNNTPNGETDEEELAKIRLDQGAENLQNGVKEPNLNNPYASISQERQSSINAANNKTNYFNGLLDRAKGRLTGKINSSIKKIKPVNSNSDVNSPSSQQANTEPLGPKGTVGKAAAKEFVKKQLWVTFLANAWWIIPTILALFLMIAFVGGIVAIECDNGKSDARTFKIVDTAITAFEASSALATFGGTVGGGAAIGKAIQAGIGTAEALVVYDSGLIRSDLNRFISKLPGCNAPCQTQGIGVANVDSNVKVGTYDCKESKYDGIPLPGLTTSPSAFYYLFMVCKIESGCNPNTQANLCSGPCVGMYQLPPRELLKECTQAKAGGYITLEPSDCESKYLGNASLQTSVQISRLATRKNAKYGRYSDAPKKAGLNPDLSTLGMLLQADAILSSGGSQDDYVRALEAIDIQNQAYGLCFLGYNGAVKNDGWAGARPSNAPKMTQDTDGRSNETWNEYYNTMSTCTRQQNGRNFIKGAISSDLYNKTKAGCNAKPDQATPPKTLYFSPNRFNQPIQLAKLNETKQSLNDNLSELVGFPVQYKSTEENLKRPEMRSYGIQALDDRINEFNKIMGGRMIVEAADTGAETEATIRARVSGYYDKGDFYQVRPITTDDKNGTLKTGYDLNIVKFLDDLHKSGLAIVTGPKSWGRKSGNHINPSGAIDIWGVGYLKDLSSGGGIKGFKIGSPGGPWAGGTADTPANNGNTLDTRIRRHNDIPSDPIAKELFEKIYDIAFASSTGSQFIGHKDFISYLRSKNKNTISSGGRTIQDDKDVYKSYNGAHFHHFHVALVSYFQKAYNGGSITVNGSSSTPNECCPDNSPSVPVESPNPPVQGPPQKSQDEDETTDGGEDATIYQPNNNPTDTTPPTPTVPPTPSIDPNAEDAGGDATGDEQTGTTPQPAPADTTLDSNAIGFLNFFQPIKASAVDLSEYDKLEKETGYIEKYQDNAGVYPAAQTAYNTMKSEAAKENINLKPAGSLSAGVFYRSVDQQIQIVSVKPASTRYDFSSLPGHSQHHTGLAFDLVSLTLSTSSSEYKWLDKNGGKYGFIATYMNDESKGDLGPKNEPWHWVYVGDNSAMGKMKDYITRAKSVGYDPLKGDAKLLALYNSASGSIATVDNGSSSGSSSNSCCPGQSGVSGGTTAGLTFGSLKDSDINKKYYTESRGTENFTRKYVVIHHTSTGKKNTVNTNDMQAEAFKKLVDTKGGGYVQFMTGSKGEIYQIEPDTHRPSGSIGAIIKSGGKLERPNDTALQIEMHYDPTTGAGKPNEKPTSEMMNATAKIVAKYSPSPLDFYSHWGVQPFDRSDVTWMSPDGIVTPELLEFVKAVKANGAGPEWNKDDKEIAKTILKNNIENAIAVRGKQAELVALQAAAGPDASKFTSFTEIPLSQLQSALQKLNSTSFLDFFQPITTLAVESPDQILLIKVDPVVNTTLTNEEKAFLDMIAAKELGKYADRNAAGSAQNIGKYQIGNGDVPEALVAAKKAGYDTAGITVSNWLEPKNQDIVAIGRVLRNAQLPPTSSNKKLGEIIKNGDGFIIALGNASREFQALPAVPGFTHAGAVQNNGYTIEVATKYYQKMLSIYGGASAGNTSGLGGIDCGKSGGTVSADGGFASIMKKISDQYQCGQTIKSSEIIGKAGVDWPTIDYRKNGTGCCYGAVTGGLKVAELSDPSSGWGKAYSIIKNKLNYNKAVDFHTSMQADGGGGKKLYEAAGLKFTQDPKAAPAGAIIVIGQGATVKSSAGDINVKVADGQFVNYAPMNWMNTVPSNEILGVYYPG